MIHGTLARVLALVSLAVTLAAAVYGNGRMPHCATEDGGPIPCVWDGHTDGNGHGDSYIVTVRP